MKNTVLLSTIILAFILFSYSQAYSATADTYKGRDTMKEEIWALEEAYFANPIKQITRGYLPLCIVNSSGGRAPCQNRLTKKKVLVS